MATYLAPGVYVEEVKSDSAPIAGVGTSTAGFIGLVETNVANDCYTSKITGENVGSANGSKKEFKLSNYPVVNETGKFEVKMDSQPLADPCEIQNRDDTKQSFLVFTSPNAPQPANNGDSGSITIDYEVGPFTEANEVKLCTNFREFTKFFGSFLDDLPGQKKLCHAVYGFFNNGGTRCYVTWGISKEKIVSDVLPEFEGIDEIAIVAAPGITDESLLVEIDAHCQKMQDRFAILDAKEEADLSSTTLVSDLLPFNSDYAGIYFPWIQVSDPPGSDKTIWIGPSGHIAGIYARVDTERGVHKAPANEVVIGALGLKYRVSKIKQEGLNPDGINCIRNINNGILVWGARTMGGDANTEYKYINVRRLMIYLRESIEEGTGWIVFEPNAPDLWAAIRRNVTDFLTTVWQTGALFGDKPEQAFYVKCDEETNPPELRDIGQVVTEIGVAIVKPAEFVIFRISQWSDSTSS